MKVRREEDANEKLTKNEYVFKCCVCGVCFEGDRALRCHEQGALRASLGRYKSIDSDDVARMDELDRQARRKARRVGQSQPRSAGPTDKRPASDQEDRLKKRRLTFKQSLAV